jgi:hypothetical protein
MAKPAVIVVGADKGGVGKTTVSRTLLDYFDANNVPNLQKPRRGHSGRNSNCCPLKVQWLLKIQNWVEIRTRMVDKGSTDGSFRTNSLISATRSVSNGSMCAAQTNIKQ